MLSSFVSKMSGGAGLALVGAIVSTFPAITLAEQVPAYLNLTSALADTKAALANTGDADILVLGDSLSFRPGSWLPVFRQKMQTQYGNGGYGYQGYSFWTGGALDPGWNYGIINQDTAPYYSLDGLWATTTVATNGSLTPISENISLQYLARSGGGVFKPFYYVNGNKEYLATIDTNSNQQGLRTWDFAPTKGTQAIGIETNGIGEVTILGQNNTSNTPGVRIHRAANGGWGAENFLRRNSTFDDQMKEIDPDLVMVWLGQNDPEYDRTSYATAMNQLVDRIKANKPTAEIVLIGNYDSGSPAIYPLVQGMYDVAAQRGVGFINLYDTAGPYSFFQGSGFLDEPPHFSMAGGDYMGDLLYRAFQSNGTSLVPEPTSLGVIGIASLVLIRRKRA